MRKTLAGIIVWSALALVACIPARPPQPGPTPQPQAPAVIDINDPTFPAQCVDVFAQELQRAGLTDQLAECVARFRRGESGADVRAWAHTLPAPPVPPVVALAPLTVDGKIFLAGGQPWRWRGVSAFKLVHWFETGDLARVDAFLAAYAGYNILRVWDYTPVDHNIGDGRDWEGREWASSPPDVWVKFLRYVERTGWRVELTLLTDDDPARIEPAKRLVEALVSARVTNVLFEAANEPLTNGKRTDLAALRSTLEAAGRAGYLHTSGVYEDTTQFWGNYGVFHSARDGDWPRRAHDAVDYWGGGGPNHPGEPALRMPWVCDEPGKHQDVGTSLTDWRAYVGGCSVMGGGFTFHSETGKFADLPTAVEIPLIVESLRTLNAFPDDAPRGAYGRPSDDSLRTYTVGGYAVRVRPTTPRGPFAGTPLDADGILWRLNLPFLLSHVQR